MNLFSRFLCIPVHIQPIFWLLAALIGWLNSGTVGGTLIWSGVVFLSVLIHEYGHALTAVAFGQTARIELVALGGVTQRSGVKLSLWKEFIIVLNGPVAGFLLFITASFLLSLFKGPPNHLGIYALKITAMANFFWTMVNLLPVYPLDGGRLLSIVMEGIFGVRGIKIALFVSMLFSAICSVGFFMVRQVFAAALFLMITFENYRSWKNSLSLTAQDQDEELQTLLKKAKQEAALSKFEEAVREFKKIRELSQKGILYTTATEHLAAIWSQQGKFKEAYEALNELKGGLSQDGSFLLQQLAYRVGELRHAINLGNQLYQDEPGFESALINALCHSLLGEVRPAIGWLNCAIQDGLPSAKQILKKKEFDILRDDTLFQELVKKADSSP
ncbi:site-2 protease family protein [Parachlamydia sp. AcF125]|uniref:site-2 protease family protein n=1 Tax=Parachlamydia sp. AcF125 TaxID=2795736 RepID=UPI001BC8D43C|nr:site-2 protease family protein [Parachlamydia sp. AcF125]MBS4167571.1 Stage IV sporulation protein FB [Parachlamydia sp. AcF125]